ncbi:MAG: DUF2336 domain-containing protein [Rhodospirillales bacterium]
MDHKELLSLARDKSDRGRAKLSEAVSDMFSGVGDSLSDSERSLMLEILQDLIGSCERSVRQSISLRLAEVPNIPHELALELANDEADIAFPILAKCNVLLDTDLIDIVRTRTVQHQLAVAIRNPVNYDVSDALVEAGNEEVITRLLENKAARITDATMEYLVDQSERVKGFQAPILHRDDLDPALAERMFIWVSAALREYILDHYSVDETVIDRLLEETALDHFKDMAIRGKTKAISAKLADALAEEGQATPEIMLLALECGEVALFISMLQRQTGLSEAVLSRFITESSGEGLVVIAKALDIGKPQFVQIYTLCRKAYPPPSESFGNFLKRALGLFASLRPDAAKALVEGWDRRTTHSQAINDVKTAFAL